MAWRSTCCGARPPWRSPPGMHVFPGGSVDPRDGERGSSAWAGPPRRGVGGLARLRRGAWRGRWCARPYARRSRSPACCSPAPRRRPGRRRHDRRRLGVRPARAARPSVSMAELLARRGLVLRSDLLRPWAHWITPEFEPRRFDTRFFVAAVPPGQRPRDVSGEADRRRSGCRCATRSRGYEAGELAMLPPTIDRAARAGWLRHRRRRAGAAAARTVRPVMPRARGPATSPARAARRGGRRRVSDRPAARLGHAGARRQPRPDDAGGHQHLRAARTGGAPRWSSTRGRWTRRTSPRWPRRGRSRSILLTHGHPDHAEGAVAAAGDDRCADGAPPTRTCLRRRRAADRRRGRSRRRRRSSVRVLATPGHTGDSVSFVVAATTSAGCSPATRSWVAAPRWSPTRTAGSGRTWTRWPAARPRPAGHPAAGPRSGRRPDARARGAGLPRAPRAAPRPGPRGARRRRHARARGRTPGLCRRRPVAVAGRRAVGPGPARLPRRRHPPRTDGQLRMP